MKNAWSEKRRLASSECGQYLKTKIRRRRGGREAGYSGGGGLNKCGGVRGEKPSKKTTRIRRGRYKGKLTRATP